LARPLAKNLIDELRKQSPDNSVDLHDPSDNHDQITLKRGRLKSVILGLREHATELRRFAK
jgi:hypothetical protein